MARPQRRIGNEADGAEIEGGADDLMERPEDTVEAQMVEVERAENDDVIDVVDGDQLDSDVDQLVDHADNVEASLDDGGMEPAAARATEIAVEDICNRWNFKRSRIGTENFGSSSSRREATRLGLESIMDSVKQGWAAILEWIKKAIRSIKDIWRKYVNAGKSIKARVEKLRKRVDKLTGSPDEKETVDGEKVWQLASGGTNKLENTKFESMKSNNMTEFANNFGKAMELSLTQATSALESEMITKKGANVSVDDEAITEANKGPYSWTIDDSKNKFKNKFPAKATHKKAYATFGGLIITYKLPFDTTKAADGTNRHTGVDGSSDLVSHIEYIPCQNSDIDKINLKPLGTDRMGDLLDAVYVVGAQLEEYIKKFSKVEAGFDKLERAADKMASRANKASGKKDAATEDMKKDRYRVKLAKSAFDNAKMLDRIYREISRNFAQGVMAYVQASFPAYAGNNDD